MNLQGKKIIILAEDLYEELELWYPLLRLREAGAEVVRDGNLISSRTPDDLPAFCRTIIEALSSNGR
jgi:putative intracellular protease/amidase